jgi:transcription antitermination protein NusB
VTTVTDTLTSRRQARAIALQVLYGMDEVGADVEAVREAVATWGDRFELESDQPARELAATLVDAAAGDVARRGRIDDVIVAGSRNWRLERMARVDRNILRLAVGEFVYTPTTPLRVVINEAVELAKRFGTAESPAFINGVLDRIAANLGRRDEAESATDGESASDAGPASDPGPS